MPRSPIRVLYHIAHPQRLAGANRSLFALVESLPSTVEPIVALTQDGSVADAFRSLGVRVHILPASGTLATFGRGILRLSGKKLARVVVRDYLPDLLRNAHWMRRHEVDVLHASDPRSAIMMGPAAKLARIPVVAHLRGQKPVEGLFWRAFELIPDRFVTVCEAIQGDFSPAARRRALAVYNGIDGVPREGRRIPWLTSLSERGVVVVLCAASVVPFKGHHHLVRAVAELNRRGLRERAVFVVAGAFPEEHRVYQEWITQLQRDLDVDNLTFAGWQDDPFAFYRSAHVEVLPSVYREELSIGAETLHVHGNEGFPRSHLEAMSFGLPAVGTDIAGVAEQIRDGATGFVVPPGDTHQLADALERLIVDDGLRQRLGDAGLERVASRFSTAQYVDGVRSVYDDVIAHGRRCP